MRKRQMHFCSGNIRLFLQILVLCMLLAGASGCSQEKNASAKIPDEENTVRDDTENADTGNDGETAPDEDLAGSPIDFEKLNIVRKEEDGISYYNFHTTKETPLPLNEWAKLDIATDKGATAPAYIRFTSSTRDTEKITEHMTQYFEENHITETFSPQPLIDRNEYVLMKYDLLIGKDTALEEDHISFAAVRFPLQLYSTMRSGEFGDDTVQERENLVTDVSVLDADTPLVSGAIIEKTVLCTVPKDYTAYGIMVPYLNAEGSTQSLCFKPEYQE